MKYKKIVIALIILFATIEFGFAQDSIPKKFHLGMYGGMNLYIQKSTQSGVANNSSGVPMPTTDTYKELFYKPSLGFVLQLNRFVFETGLSDFENYKHTYTTSSNSGGSGLSKHFIIGFEERITWLLMNPDKSFMVPYLRIGLNYTYAKDINYYYSNRMDISNLFSGFFGTGVYKNIKKKMFIRLGIIGNFISDGNGPAFNNSFQTTAIAIVELGLGYKFK